LGDEWVFLDGTSAVTSAAGEAYRPADSGPAARRGYRRDPTTPVLQLQGVVKKYCRGDEQVHVLVDFDFTLDAGEFVVVTGPSGAGKSTLLHIAGGLDAPDTGTVAVAGLDVWAMSAGARAAFRRRNLGFVFQFFNLVPMLTAIENVSLPLVLDGMAARSADARAEVLDLLRSLSDEDGAAVVLVTHDRIAAGYGAREVHLVDGRTDAIDPVALIADL
jgi:ABC-type lipoprotein export system ATPase subunit